MRSDVSNYTLTLAPGQTHSQRTPGGLSRKLLFVSTQEAQMRLKKTIIVEGKKNCFRCSTSRTTRRLGRCWHGKQVLRIYEQVPTFFFFFSIVHKAEEHVLYALSEYC